MESTQQSDRETYRAIVLGQGGNELLLKPAGEGFLLLSVEIPRWQRLAENMTVAIRNEWGQEAICLFNPDVSDPVTAPNDHNYQVMECSGPTRPHPGAEWVPVSSLSERTFADPADQVAVQRSLAECRDAGAVALRPFARLGWFRELQGWIEEVIGPLGFHLAGSFSQLNASPSFSLVRFETSGPAVWFKAVGNPNLREFPITLTLAQLFPNYLPRILAIHPEWDGWLTREVDGKVLCEVHEPAPWERSVAALAKLQIDSIDQSPRILATGARDLGAAALSKLIQPFIEIMAQLMERQTKVSPPVLGRKELLLLGDRVQGALDALEALAIPETLGHLDLNPGNIIVSPSRCVFLDWAEAYIGNPFLTFQYLLEHLRRTSGEHSADETRVVESYVAQWRRIAPRDAIAAGLALSPLLAVFAYAAGTGMFCDQERLPDPQFAGYLRSLARRMSREAGNWTNRGEKCSTQAIAHQA